MKKIVSVLLTLTLLASTGCSLSKLAGAGQKGDNPAGGIYDDAHEWATYWCGPCKQVDMDTVPNEPHDIELYTMKDKELGFKYQVSAMYMDYATSLTPEPSYSYGNFDYEYMQVFLDETDFSEIVDKYDLTIELEEIEFGHDGETYDPFYNATVNFNTERQLDEDEMHEILEFAYDALRDFDEREHFSRNQYCKEAYFYVWCAPSDRDRELGHKYTSDCRIFGWRSEHRN